MAWKLFLPKHVQESADYQLKWNTIMSNSEFNSDRPLHIGKPSWLKTKIPTGQTYFEIKRDLRQRKLATVCEEAKCPNIGECWNTRTATFMICGDTCTRACRFCHVKTGDPKGWLNPHEPQQVAESVKSMGLKYVVITMVDRDDLADGGSSHVAQVVRAIKELNPGIIVELLAGDFQGNPTSIQTILSAGIDVYAHNIETVRRLTPRVRDARAKYDQSLHTLQLAKELSKEVPILTKSALMLGLGETEEELIQSMIDLRQKGVELLTIGQYMRPTKKHLAVKAWVTPETFKKLEIKAHELGFLGVASSPLVRSSYMAYKFFIEAIKTKQATGDK